MDSNKVRKITMGLSVLFAGIIFFNMSEWPIMASVVIAVIVLMGFVLGRMLSEGSSPYIISGLLLIFTFISFSDMGTSNSSNRDFDSNGISMKKTCNKCGSTYNHNGYNSFSGYCKRASDYSMGVYCSESCCINK